MLTLRASKHPLGDRSGDDYDVLDHEGRVGRIVLTAASFTAGRDKPWFWSTVRALRSGVTGPIKNTFRLPESTVSRLGDGTGL